MRTDGRTDEQTDKMALIVAFCNFTNAPKQGTTFPRVLYEEILNFGVRSRSVVTFKPRPLYPQQIITVPTE